MDRAWHYLPVLIVAILWHVILVADYLMLRLNVSLYTSFFTPEQVAWFQEMPLWMAAAWGLAVWSGVLGTLLMITRSVPGAAFAVSFLAWLATAAGLGWLREPPAGQVTGQMGEYMLFLSVAMALILFLYTRWMHRRVR